MPQHDPLIARAATVIRVARLANRAFLVAVVVGMAASWIAPARFGATLLSAIPPADLAEALVGARLLLVIGIAMSLSTDRIFRALSAMLDSARVGTPFMAGNVEHLTTIGWCLLGLQLLELPAALLRAWFPGLGSAGPSGEISIAGWIAVLMVFTLVRVYRAGTVMQDDLDGTV